MEVLFAPSFIRQLNSLPKKLQEEAIEKIEMSDDPKNHKTLKVHKLKDRLTDRYSFSVNFSTRIIFLFSKDKPRNAFFLTIGDHDIYE